jgi:hypothetical protein
MQVLKNFPTFYGTRRFNTVLIKALHLSLPWARSVQSISHHPVSLRSILILSRMSDYRRGLNLRLDLLTTLTHESWLQLIIVPPLISTVYQSLEHTDCSFRRNVGNFQTTGVKIQRTVALSWRLREASLTPNQPPLVLRTYIRSSDLRFLQRSLWSELFGWVWRHVVRHELTDVSEDTCIILDSINSLILQMYGI